MKSNARRLVTNDSFAVWVFHKQVHSVMGTPLHELSILAVRYISAVSSSFSFIVVAYSARLTTSSPDLLQITALAYNTILEGR